MNEHDGGLPLPPSSRSGAGTRPRSAPVPEATSVGATPRRRGAVAAYLALTKPRVMELLLLTTAPTMVLAGNGLPDPWRVGAVLVGGAASAGSAAVFNMYYDRDIDAVMVRTAKRPIVTGEVSPRAALVFAWSLAVFATLWFVAVVNVLSAALSAAAIAWYVVVYTLVLKRRTAQNIVWGGLAGCFPVLIAWAAVTGAVGWPAVVLVVVVFLWTPAHYWPLSVRYSDDYRRAGVPMLGAVRSPAEVADGVLVYAVLTAVAAGVLVPVGALGPVYAVTVVVAGVWFIGHAVRYRAATRSPEPGDARPMRVFVASNVYLAALFLAVAIDPLLRA